MNRLLAFLRRNHRTLTQTIQVAALLWIGYELHALVRTVYSGPGPYDNTEVSAGFSEIADRLEKLTRVIITK